MSRPLAAGIEIFKILFLYYYIPWGKTEKQNANTRAKIGRESRQKKLAMSHQQSLLNSFIHPKLTDRAA